MLGKRYTYDGRPILRLNDLQVEMKRQVDLKVLQGTYDFETVPCCICEGSDFDTLATKDRYGLYMPITICKDCGLVQTNPRMSQESYHQFYNCEYRKLYGGRERADAVFFDGQRRKGERIAKFLQRRGQWTPSHDSLVVEIGCGAGGILHHFRSLGCQVKGVDLGEEYVNFGKEQYGLDLLVGTVRDIEIDRSPDVIIYSHVLEHILTPSHELRTAAQILSDTGILYIEVPGLKNLMNSYDMDFLKYLQNAHSYHFTLTSLTNLASKSGLEVLVGTEDVFCIVGKSTRQKVDAPLINDYKAVIKYLHRVEWLRRISPVPLYKLKQMTVTIGLRLLKSLGLYEPVRRYFRGVSA